jgi:ABC-type uncharacterized transport system auxiliary subunit
MTRPRFRFKTLLATLLTAALVGCGMETAYIADTIRPIVTSTNPAPGATGVALTPPITPSRARSAMPRPRKRRRSRPPALSLSARLILRP